MEAERPYASADMLSLDTAQQRRPIVSAAERAADMAQPVAAMTVTMCRAGRGKTRKMLEATHHAAGGERARVLVVCAWNAMVQP
jgi:hypothetical protein